MLDLVSYNHFKGQLVNVLETISERKLPIFKIIYQIVHIIIIYEFSSYISKK